MGWLSFKEDKEVHTQETQDNKLSQTQQLSSAPSIGSSESGGSGSGSGDSEDIATDNEPGSSGGACSSI
jgi:hypothetical protein